MPIYSVSLNTDLAKVVEKEMKANKYENKSEFFRDLIRKIYVSSDSTHVKETLSSNDPDRMLIERRKKDAEFIPLSELLS
ncbi:MAG: ribbon-helix-helix domain-containing protein [Patescibacteria group bacterium]